MDVSKMVRGRYAIDKIVLEIQKCICVCKNHHADLSQLRMDFIKNQQRKGLTKEQIEFKRRSRELLEAKTFLRSRHPNVRFKKDTLKLIKFIFGDAPSRSTSPPRRAVNLIRHI